MEKIKRTRPSKSVTFTLNPKNPNEAKLIELLEKRVSVQTSSYKHAVGTELIRELVLMGMEVVDRVFPTRQGVSEQIKVETRYQSDTAGFRRVTPEGSDSHELSGTIPL